MKTATITQTAGAQYPGEVERVYRLRAGSRGRGWILAEHRARGDFRATDAAIDDLTAQAGRLGYRIVTPGLDADGWPTRQPRIVARDMGGRC